VTVDGPVVVAGAAVAAVIVLTGRAPPAGRWSAWWWVAPGLALSTSASAAVSWPRLVGLGLLAASGGGVWWLAGLRRRRLEAEQGSLRVLEACATLTAELAAGQAPAAALRQAARDWPPLALAAEAAGLGADVPAALRAVSIAPGAGDMALVGAAWQVSQQAGHGLSAALMLVRDDLRAMRETRRVVASELASARATARLVALLPVGVLVMGSGAGSDPVRFLLEEPLGWACAATGLAFLLAGLGWIEAIAGQVEREGQAVVT
jgi:tight adherence protein B